MEDSEGKLSPTGLFSLSIYIFFFLIYFFVYLPDCNNLENDGKLLCFLLPNVKELLLVVSSFYMKLCQDGNSRKHSFHFN